MNEERRVEVANTVYLRYIQDEPSAAMMAQAVALGIEVALAWEAKVLTEDQVIAGPPKTSREQELEDQLDTVLWYLWKRDGWISANDTEGLVEFRQGRILAYEILDEWKKRKGFLQ